MRKIMAVISFVFGVLTFAVVAYAGREGSTFNPALAGIPALICMMTAIAADYTDEQHLDIDEAEADAASL